jgi:hypothetical protein
VESAGGRDAAWPERVIPAPVTARSPRATDNEDMSALAVYEVGIAAVVLFAASLLCMWGTRRQQTAGAAVPRLGSRRRYEEWPRYLDHAQQAVVGHPPAEDGLDLQPPAEAHDPR